VPPDDLLGQAEVFADDAHFVFEEVFQRLDQLEAKLFGESSDVVVQLYVRGGVAVPGAGFDDVGVECALGEEFGVWDFGGLGFEGLDEFCTDDFALLLRVGNAGEFFEELLRPVHYPQVEMKVVAESGYHFITFAFSQQAVIDENAD